MELKVYLAGKVSKESSFGTDYWRDGVCDILARISGHTFLNLDPAKDSPGLPLDESNSKLIFGRDCYLIKQADIVIVMLTDDISVGGSQEMLIAKYFQKPLLGIAPYGGKFFQAEKEIRDTVFKDWVHPFVKEPCDILVHTLEEAGEYLRTWETKPGTEVKNLNIIDDAIAYYETTHLQYE